MFMNTGQFGQLVKALRKEHTDKIKGKTWLQRDLFNEVKKYDKEERDQDIIGRIERGDNVKLSEGFLRALANALKLTSGERKEFFLAASGIVITHMVRHNYAPEEVLRGLLDRVRAVNLPAYIIDSYCDIVAANRATLELLDLDAAGLNLGQMINQPFGLNMLQFVFSKKAVAFYRPQMAGNHWNNYIYQNMMIFRTLSLRYRYTNYFRELWVTLMGYKEFENAWPAAYYQQEDHYLDNEHIHFNSVRWGKLLIYFSTSFTALTHAGELHFNIYVPSNQTTQEAFVKIINESAPNEWSQPRAWPGPEKYSQIITK